MDNGSFNGQIISRREIKKLLLEPEGIRMKELRLKLADMYPGEFTLKAVAKGARYSENGYAKIESGETNIQSKTNEEFTKFFGNYNVPAGFFDENPDIMMKPFYLGKKEDMLPYFDHFYEANGQKHFLDPRELPEIDNSDFRYYEPSIDETQSDVIEGEDGGYLLNQIGVEVTLSAYQVSTGIPLWEKRLNPMASIDPGELHQFEKALQRDIAVLVKQYSELFSLRRQLNDHEQKNALLDRLLQAYRRTESIQPTDSEFDNYVNSLLDEINGIVLNTPSLTIRKPSRPSNKLKTRRPRGPVKKRQ